MNVIDWERRLEERFSALQELRGDRPVFALEHGLSELERTALLSSVRAHAVSVPPLNLNPLVWVVYATEYGYAYEGNQYWISFEADTPGWAHPGKRFSRRTELREQFEHFHSAYGAARPSGAWAEHFANICWPITNAILPKDLQKQFAELLHGIRHQAAATLSDPEEVGKRIAALCTMRSSRADYLRSDPRLVGQITLAFLLEGTQESEALVAPETLRRIVQDFDGQARNLLAEAQVIARSQRTRISGLAAGGAGAMTSETTYPQVPQPRDKIDIRLSAVLRPDRNGSWSMFLELPDLAPLAALAEEYASVIGERPCVVAGYDRSLARGAVLNRRHLAKLARWPSPQEILLRFVPSYEPLDRLLLAGKLLDPGPVWLFRVASDGQGNEVRSRIVRPGQRYLIVTTNSLPVPPDSARPIAVACRGFNGIDVQVPNTVPQSLQTFLSGLGLSLSKSIRLWPVGVPPAAWDGEGRVEWLASDRPCIGITVSHQAEDISLKWTGDDRFEPLELGSLGPGEHVFVELPPLQVGTYQLRVSLDGQEIGELDVSIRPPRTWSPGQDVQTPFSIDAYPATPTLEELWECRARISAHGPSGRRAHCNAVLVSGKGQALHEAWTRELEVPFSEDEWKRFFGDFRRHVEQWYDEADACVLSLSLSELGSCSLRCKRSFTSLRWRARLQGEVQILELSDDSSGGESTSVVRYAGAAPLRGEVLTNSGLLVADVAGLYVAKSARAESGIVASHPRSRLAAAQRELPPLQGGRSAAFQALRDIDQWANARVTGTAASRLVQRSVLKSLTQFAVGTLAGHIWFRAEQSITSQSGFAPLISGLKPAFATNVEERSLFDMLLDETVRWVDLRAAERVARLRECLDLESTDLCESSLRIASGTEQVARLGAKNVERVIDQLLERPGIIKSARVAVLALERQLPDSPLEVGRPYAGWDWE